MIAKMNIILVYFCALPFYDSCDSYLKLDNFRLISHLEPEYIKLLQSNYY